MRLPDFEAWAIFACVVEHRSFSGAAAALGISKATVSKAVARLEAALEVTLFHRTSRRLALTEPGKALAERAQRLLADANAAEEAARGEARTPSGTVRVAAPMSFGLLHVAPVIADFLSANPAIRIDLHLADEKVDIVAGGFDIALRIAALPDSSLRSRKLGDIPARVVAAPAYLHQRGRPKHPAELAHHDCFAYAYQATPDLWRFSGPNGERAAVRPSGRLGANSGEAMLPALCGGLGVAVLPEFIVGRDLAAGRLEAILEDWRGLPAALHLLTPPGALRPARVTLLIDYLAERLRGVCRAEHKN